MALTVSSTRYAIPTLIGRGLSERAARTVLDNAKRYGAWLGFTGKGVVPVSYSDGRYTIENPQ